MRRLVLALAVVPHALAGTALAEPPQAAFEQGRAFGASRTPALGQDLATGARRSEVPHAGSAPPEAAAFDGGQGVLAPLGVARQDACLSGPPHPDGRQQQACEATNFLARRGGTAQFTLTPQDPLLAAGAPIANRPETILGALDQRYAGCATRSVTVPAPQTIEVCALARAPETRTCQRVLSVTVTPQHSCVPGTWFTSQFIGAYAAGWRAVGIRVHAYCQMDGGLGLYVHNETFEGGQGAAVLALDAATGQPAPQSLPGFFAQDYHFGHWYNRVAYHGGGCDADTCRVHFEVYGEQCGDEGVCFRSGTQASGVFAFARPKTTVLETDRWEDGCAALEARLQ